MAAREAFLIVELPHLKLLTMIYTNATGAHTVNSKMRADQPSFYKYGVVALHARQVVPRIEKRTKARSARGFLKVASGAMLILG